MYVCMRVGDALIAGQRNREALNVQIDPHAEEIDRLAAMAMEVVSALSALQASNFLSPY